MPSVTLHPDRQTSRDIDNALQKLKKKVEACNILKDVHAHAQFERPGDKRKRKKAAAVMRWKRERSKDMLPPKLY
jgi:small subunit ribosomal protein S21